MMKNKYQTLNYKIEPKQSTIDFLKKFSAQFSSIYSSQIGIIVLSNN